MGTYNKLTPENLLLRFREVHEDKYDYDFSEFTCAKTPIKIKCRHHGWFKMRYDSHLRGSGCSACKGMKPYTKDTILEKFLSIHGDRYIYDLTTFTNTEKKMRIVCREHGDFWQTPIRHYRCNCPWCAGVGEPNASVLEKEFRLVHGDKYIYDFTTLADSKTPIRILCPKHGEFYQLIANHRYGNGCIRCAGSEWNTKEVLELRFKSVHNDKYTYDWSTLKNSTTKMKMLCKKHGEFWQTPAHHSDGSGCGKCSSSGYNRNKEGTFYIYEFLNFIGFGISNNFGNRHKNHMSTFRKLSIVPELITTVGNKGDIIFKLEQNVKLDFDIINSGIKGFKKECVDVKDKTRLLEYVYNSQAV